MAEEKFETQSGGHVKEGHEQSDLSIRGIVLFGVFLTVGGILSFLLVLAMIKWVLEPWEKSRDARLTPMEQQLQKQREVQKEGLGKVAPAYPGELKPPPDDYARSSTEGHLTRTFKTPRLQYNDEHDMAIFVGSEQDWLSSTGKDTNGNVHIPVNRAIDLLAQRGLPQVSGSFLPANVGAASAAYPSGASSTGQQPARSNNTGGNK